MGAIGFYVFYGITWLMTLLPLRILYVFSDILFPLLYYFPGYRRKVVETNLKNSFPEKSEKELNAIARKYYHHLCDLIFETLKLVHMSKEQHMKRMRLTNPELLERFYDEGRDVVVVLGHYGNWEWLNILPLYTRLRNVPIYKPLANKYFDRFMLNLRLTNDCDPTAMSNVVREVIKNRRNNRRALYGFMTDQTPPKGEIRFWINFLNQDTPVYLGSEKIAIKYDMAIVFFNIQKIRRGYYTFTSELLFEKTAGINEQVITETHVKRLEEIIREKPEYWLWSHRRWKHKHENPDV
jgi:Kdo2-lipid IVA lauroyltransferase/acyltransferase